jgi:hypothetical protein
VVSKRKPVMEIALNSDQMLSVSLNDNGSLKAWLL